MSPTESTTTRPADGGSPDVTTPDAAPRPHHGDDTVGTTVARLWPGARWEARSLDDGMTNRNYKVHVEPVDGPARDVVIQLQLPKGLAHEIGIVRENQMSIWPRMTAIGLAPELIDVFDDLGVTVVEFVEGTRLTDVADRALGIRLTASALARLHEHTRGDETPGLSSDPFGSMHWLEGRIAAQEPGLLDDFRWALDVVERIRTARGPYGRCQVHTDASQVNIFLVPDEDRVVLIDWEYIGAGDRYLDLAHFAARFELTGAEEEILLSAYEGVLDTRALAIVRVYRFISMLREGLWSVLAGAIGFLEEFDHAAYARDCLQQASDHAAGPIFDESIRLLEAESSRRGA